MLNIRLIFMWVLINEIISFENIFRKDNNL